MFIVTAKEMYDIDHYTISDVGLGSVLMENAGRAVSEKLMESIMKTDQIVVLAGGGHNGGDGFVVARTLHNLQYHVSVLQVTPDEKLTDATRHQKELLQKCGGAIVTVDTTKITSYLLGTSVIVDAITGLGIKGRLRSPLADIVDEVNLSEAFVCSIDLPSGLPADEGTSDFTAVHADMTVIIGAVKESACCEKTASFYGEWEVVSIGHPIQAFANSKPRYVLNKNDFRRTMPQRKRYAHKGSHGKGLLVGGSDLMPGAAVLAGTAALKTGAGLVTVASTHRVIHHVANHCPEVTYMELPQDQGEIYADQPPNMDAFDAVAVGVGMGRGKKTATFFKSVLLGATCPLIIDADGIFHLKSCLDDAKKRSQPTIITPHTGEMARLLGIDVKALLEKPFYYSRQLAERYHLFVVLKGKATIITSPFGEQAG